MTTPRSNQTKVFVRPWRVRGFRAVMGLMMTAYLAATVWYGGRHLLGDQQPCPLQYVFTWDMFPNYPMWSSRRFAVVQTKTNAFRLVFPNRRAAYRRGRSGTHTRFDLPRNDDRLRTAVEQAVKDFAAASDDPPRYVFLCEEYWPVGANRHGGPAALIAPQAVKSKAVRRFRQFDEAVDNAAADSVDQTSSAAAETVSPYRQLQHAGTTFVRVIDESPIRFERLSGSAVDATNSAGDTQRTVFRWSQP